MHEMKRGFHLLLHNHRLASKHKLIATTTLHTVTAAETRLVMMELRRWQAFYLIWLRWRTFISSESLMPRCYAHVSHKIIALSYLLQVALITNNTEFGG